MWQQNNSKIIIIKKIMFFMSGVITHFKNLSGVVICSILLTLYRLKTDKSNMLLFKTCSKKDAGLYLSHGFHGKYDELNCEIWESYVCK